MLSFFFKFLTLSVIFVDGLVLVFFSNGMFNFDLEVLEKMFYLRRILR